MDGDGFARLMQQLRHHWDSGNAEAAAACFAENVQYADPRRYRFSTRDELIPFFDPGPRGHRVVWHRLLFDEAAQTGVVEYTYEGHHRYHGAAIVQIEPGGTIAGWREWQHRDDERDWERYLEGPG